MEERIQVEVGNTSSVSGQSETTTQKFWRYGKQVLKGAALFGVGLLGYVGIKRFANKGQAKSAPKHGALAQHQDSSVSVVHIQSENYESQLRLEAASYRVRNLKSHKQQHHSSKRTLGKQFLINVQTFDYQSTTQNGASVIGDDLFMVPYASGQQDNIHGQYSIYASIFSKVGNRLGKEFKVNTFYQNNQLSPASTRLNDDKFVIVWEDATHDGDGNGVFGQLFNKTGAKLGSEFQINTYTTSDQRFPIPAHFSNGSFVVVWQSTGQDGDSDGIYAQLFGVNGAKIGKEFQVNTYAVSTQNAPRIATFTNSNFVVTWNSLEQDNSGWGVYAQLFSKTGVKIGGEFRVNNHTIGNQQNPSVAALPNGNFVIAWESNGPNGVDFNIYAQLFSPTGQRIHKEFMANNYTTDNQIQAKVGVLPSSNFILTWTSGGQDGSGTGVFAQLFSQSGDKIGNEFQVNSKSANNQNAPSVVCLPISYCLFTWNDNNNDGYDFGVFGKVISFNETNLVVYTINNKRVFTEDHPYTFSQSPLRIGGVSYEPNIRVSLKVQPAFSGNLNASTYSHIESTFDPKTGRWQAEGLLEPINSLLNTLTFYPAHNYDKDVPIIVEVKEVPKQLSQDFAGVMMLKSIPVDDPPEFGNNKITIKKGERKVITPSELSITDVDTAPKNLKYLLDNIEHGHFEHIKEKNVALLGFTDADVRQGKILFVHDGSDASPSGSMSITDGTSTMGPRSFNFSFLNKVSVSAATIAIPTSLVALTGLGVGLVIWRKRLNYRKAKQRARHPLADKVYQKLKLAGVNDFELTLGRIYVDNINKLKLALNEKHDYDVDNMELDAINELADYIVRAIENNIVMKKSTFGSTQLNVADLQTKLDRIVNDTMTYIDEDGWAPRQGKVIDKFDRDSDEELEMDLVGLENASLLDHVG